MIVTAYTGYSAGARSHAAWQVANSDERHLIISPAYLRSYWGNLIERGGGEATIVRAAHEALVQRGNVVVGTSLLRSSWPTLAEIRADKVLFDVPATGYSEAISAGATNLARATPASETLLDLTIYNNRSKYFYDLIRTQLQKYKKREDGRRAVFSIDFTLSEGGSFPFPAALVGRLNDFTSYCLWGKEVQS